MRGTTCGVFNESSSVDGSDTVSAFRRSKLMCLIHFANQLCYKMKNKQHCLVYKYICIYVHVSIYIRTSLLWLVCGER